MPQRQATAIRPSNSRCSRPSLTVAGIQKSSQDNQMKILKRNVRTHFLKSFLSFVPLFLLSP
jgi:hypothetical protein